MKITFMGAGSTVFARNVIGDCMCADALKDSVFALYDIDARRLEESRIILEAMRKNFGGCGKIECYLGVENRKDALRGAAFVINAIQVGLYDPCTIIDFEVPKKYGLRQTIADTLGIEMSRVSVKATTEEGLGFTGSGEGIAAQAVCCLQSMLDMMPDDRMMSLPCDREAGSGSCGGCPRCPGQGA